VYVQGTLSSSMSASSAVPNPPVPNEHETKIPRVTTEEVSQAVVLLIHAVADMSCCCSLCYWSRQRQHGILSDLQCLTSLQAPLTFASNQNVENWYRLRM
jgi:hypothetical protein